MRLKSFKRPDQVEHATAWERDTLDNLAAARENGPSLDHSLYGKTGHNVRPGECSPEKIGSWSITADGCLLALADMADRHGHDATHQHLASIYGYALDFVPWWAREFNDYPGPGEYGVVEPCWTKDEMLAIRPNSDTDPWRHYGAHGLLLLGINPAVRQHGGWTDDQIRAFTDHHFNAVMAAGMLGQGEFLRAPYRSDMLLGCSQVYRHLGDNERADTCYILATSFWRWLLRPEIFWRESAAGPLFSYGPLVLDANLGAYVEPWRYGFFHWGGQGWYYAMVAQALTQLGLEAARRGDQAFLSWAISRVVEIADWCDPRNVANADGVPLRSAADTIRMKNVLMHGWTRGDAPDGAYITDRALDGGFVMGISDFEALDKRDTFHRGHADKAFHVDGGNWASTLTDPFNVDHRRRHWSDGSYQPRQMSIEALNAGGLLQALWVKALVTMDAELTRFLEIRMSMDMAFANSTDLKVSLGRSIGEMGTPGMQGVESPGRGWAWRIKAGWEARAMMVGKQGGEDGIVAALSPQSLTGTQLSHVVA